MDAVRNLLIDGLLAEFRESFPTSDESASCAYREGLESKSTDELWDLWGPVNRKRQLAEKRRETEAAAQRFAGVADLWAKKPYWKRLEAVALLLALDPYDSIQVHRSQPYLSVDSSREQAGSDLDDLLTRAIAVKELPELLMPAALLVWLERKAVSVPHELKSAVERYAPPRPVVTPAPAPKAETVDEDASEPVQYTKGTRTELRIQAILIAVAAMEWERMSIPEGGKKKILKACLTCPRLFTSESTFDKAWQAALDGGELRTENHDKYAQRV